MSSKFGDMVNATAQFETLGQAWEIWTRAVFTSKYELKILSLKQSESFRCDKSDEMLSNTGRAAVDVDGRCTVSVGAHNLMPLTSPQPSTSPPRARAAPNKLNRGPPRLGHPKLFSEKAPLLTALACVYPSKMGICTALSNSRLNMSSQKSLDNQEEIRNDIILNDSQSSANMELGKKLGDIESAMIQVLDRVEMACLSKVHSLRKTAEYEVARVEARFQARVIAFADLLAASVRHLDEAAEAFVHIGDRESLQRITASRQIIIQVAAAMRNY